MKKVQHLGDKLPLLHAIRGIAAFYVVVFHAKFILWSGGREYLSQFPRSTWNVWDYCMFSVDMLFSAGSQMVMIFFVLSGFFIAMSLENIKGTVTQKLKTFYSVRFIRIYIPYIASIILAVLVLIWISYFSPGLFQLNADREFNNRLIAANKDLTFTNLARGLIFDKNEEYIGFNYAYWSLLYEGIFYLIIPFIYQFKRYYLLISAAFFVAGIFIMNAFHFDNIYIKFLFEYNFYFAIGQAIYIYREQLSVMAQRRYYKTVAILCSIILFLAFNVLALVHQDFWANFLASAMAALLIVLFINYDTKSTLFVKKTKQLGEMSYSLYLVHIPTLIFTYVLLYKYSGKTVFYDHIYFVGVIVSLFVGWFFFKFIEKPSLVLIKKIKRSLQDTAIPQAAIKEINQHSAI